MSPSPKPTPVNGQVSALTLRAMDSLVDNYSILAQDSDKTHFLNQIPKQFQKKLFKGLIAKGIMEVQLLARIVDSGATSLDLKSASGLDNSGAEILQGFKGLETLLLNHVTADSSTLCTMFSSMVKLSTLEINNCPGFDDDVLSVIVECCPCLTILNATHSGITMKGVEILANGSLYLEELDIRFAKDLSLAGIFNALESKIIPANQNLRKLWFSVGICSYYM